MLILTVSISDTFMEDNDDPNDVYDKYCEDVEEVEVTNACDHISM